MWGGGGGTYELRSESGRQLLNLDGFPTKSRAYCDLLVQASSAARTRFASSSSGISLHITGRWTPNFHS
jgi:hypothetical protein